MRLLGASCLIFLISNLCVATTDDEQSIIFQQQHHHQCQVMGDKCQHDNDCCSDLTCFSIRAKTNVCGLSTLKHRSKRYSEDIIVPFYFSNNRNRYSNPSTNRFDSEQNQRYQRKKN